MGKKRSSAAVKQAVLSASFLAPIDESTPPPDGYQAKEHRRASDKGVLPITLEKYLELVDWSGRQLRSDKRGSIPSHLAPILERLGIDVDFLLIGAESFGEIFAHFAGRPSTLRAQAEKAGRKWVQGVRQDRRTSGAHSQSPKS